MFNLGDVYQSLSSSPFLKEISNTELSSRFVLLKFELYDGTKDPTKHVLHYKQLMEMIALLNSTKDPIMCKVFASSLSSSMLVWFSRLLQPSICFFSQLIELFDNLFFISIKQERETKNLFTIVQQKGESIRSNIKRFNEVKIECCIAMNPLQ